MKRYTLAAVTALLVLVPTWHEAIRATAPLYTVEDLGNFGGLVPTLAGINASGKVVATANVTPSSGALSADIELAQLDLRAFQSYLSKETLLTLLSGELGTKMHVERTADGALTLEGDADVAKLRTIDNDLKLDFVK